MVNIKVIYGVDTYTARYIGTIHSTVGAESYTLAVNTYACAVQDGEPGNVHVGLKRQVKADWPSRHIDFITHRSIDGRCPELEVQGYVT